MPTNPPAEIRVFINADGSFEHLHADSLDAAPFPGAARVRRASNVEYDDGLTPPPLRREPAWVATLLDGREIARHPRRAEVLRVERLVIDGMLERGETIPA